jgi:N-acetylglucosamine-6-phosphate deacetylase
MVSEVYEYRYFIFGPVNDRAVYFERYSTGLVLVTDAISALGLTEGIHQIGNLDVEIKNDCAYILGTETLCGSITPLNKCIKLFDEFCSECSLFLLFCPNFEKKILHFVHCIPPECGKVKALETATLHPAQVLGIADQKGTLNPGADADIVFLDDDFEVLSTWIAGRCRYTRRPDTYEIIKN